MLASRRRGNPPPDEASIGPEAEPGARPARRALTTAVVVLYLLPVAASLIAVATDQWHPPSDFAILEAKVRDVGTSATPLVGPFSRFEFDHPGPLLYYLLAGPYRLLGSNPAGLLVGAVLINAAAVASIALSALRRSVLFALWVGVLVDLLVWSQAFTSSAVLSPWNPYVAVLPFLAFVFACWRLARGDRWALVVAAVAGSFVLQCHVGYLLLVAAIGVVTAGVAVVRHRHDIGGVPVAVAAAVAALLWIPVVADQVGGSGNLGAIVEWSTSSTEPPLGLDSALRVAGPQLAARSSWSGATGAVDTFAGGLIAGEVWEVLIPVGALAAALLVALRRRHASLRDLVVLTTVGVITGIVALSRVTGIVAAYVVLWLRPLALLVWLCASWGAWTVLAPRVGRAHREVVAATAAVLLLATGAATVATARQPVPNERESLAIEALGAQLRDTVAPDTTIVVRPTGEAFLAIGAGVQMDLERHGYDVFEPLPPETSRHSALLGTHRQLDPAAADEVLEVVSGAADVAAVEGDPAREVVASYSSLGPRDEARWSDLDAQLDNEEKALALLSAPEEATTGPATEWAELTRSRFPVAVVRVDGER